ncbi:MAG TPA: sigma-70 family RNA polymerase sigma factor [Chthoniobacteraceae bacterium]|nr:sigma-70 family RNA polymerase sigma factor [Chthoniobacteraceae bacterium]
MARPADSLLATRRTLVERLVNLEDRRRWQEFFERYWKLIYGVARRAGLNDAEAQDVVQETVITVAKNISKYEREAGSFKNWLLHITRWRIADQFRKRAPGNHVRRESADESHRETATIERIADGIDVGGVWHEEWQRHLLDAALQRLKRRVDPQHYQIFDCAVLKEWPAAKVARELGVNVARVYLVKHRLAAMLKREIVAVQEHA